MKTIYKNRTISNIKNIIKQINFKNKKQTKYAQQILQSYFINLYTNDKIDKTTKLTLENFLKNSEYEKIISLLKKELKD